MMTIVEQPKKANVGLKPRTPSLESFEETYKTAYSHGLEAIYSLENVDLKTVRKIEEHAPESVSAARENEEHESLDQTIDIQKEFDFGENYRDWITPFFLNEPIQVLGLSFQAEACLREHGMKKVLDLLSQNFKDHRLLKGIGQGHIDEAQKKLKDFIKGRSLEKSYSIDFKSLLLSLSEGITFKKLSLFLKDFHLDDIVPLTPAERIELKAFDLSKDDGWKGEVLGIFQNNARKNEAKEKLRSIARVFILPWMAGRHGIASQYEIIERLERVSEEPSRTHLYMDFFAEIFTEGKFPFADFLLEAEKELYCCGDEISEAYHDIIQSALSYFYNPSARYFFDELVTFLMREFTGNWKAYSPEFSGECLKRTSRFQILRGSTGKMEVRLS